MTDHVYQQLREHLAYLKLPAVAEQLAAALEQAETAKPSYTRFLADLLAVEITATEQRRLDGRLRFASFPQHKTLEQFDFDAQPSLDRRLVEELATLRFVQEKANVLLIGPPGVGKTMLATALGPQSRARRLPRLLHHRRRPRRAHHPRRDRRPLADHDALLGTARRPCHRRAWLSADARRSRLHLFQVISRRYQHGSVILTTNRGIAQWGEIFEDTTVAAAILDRLLHHATVLQIDGDSYRMRGHRARLQQLTRTPSRPSRRPSHERRQRSGSERPAARTAHRPAPMHRAVPAHARQLAAQLSTLFERDVEIVERLNDAHHRLHERQRTALLRTRARRVRPHRRRRRGGGDRHQPDRRAASATARPGQQPDARGPATDPLADPSRLLRLPTAASSAASSPSRSASSPNSSPRRCAPPAGARTRRGTPTCTSSPAPILDRPLHADRGDYAAERPA